MADLSNFIYALAALVASTGFLVLTLKIVV
jgi:hypothetical protein